MMVQRFFVVVLAFALAATDSQNPSKEGSPGTDSIACPAREALDRWRSLLFSGCRRCRSRACSASVSVSAGLRDRSRWPIR